MGGGPEHRAIALKAEGNALFGAQKYAEATAKYTEALASGASDSALKKACLLNRAASALNLLDYTQCVADADAVLGALDPSSVKAFYRRGQAHLGLANYAKATSDLRHATELAPRDTTISAAFALAKQVHSLLNPAATLLGKGLLERAAAQATLVILHAHGSCMGPCKGHAHLLRARARFRMDDFNAASADFTEAKSHGVACEDELNAAWERKVEKDAERVHRMRTLPYKKTRVRKRLNAGPKAAEGLPKKLRHELRQRLQER